MSLFIRSLTIFLFFFLVSTSFAHAVSLINGGVISDAISTPGELDSYTFFANAGESVQIRVADTSNSAFRPRVFLYRPDGSEVTNTNDFSVAQIICPSGKCTIDATGTYTVVVADWTSNTGTYDIYFTRAPGANEGGALINGGVISGQIDLGELDSYTFFANAGESVQIRV
ncbi:MAG: peptidase, partial [Candidatus Competibacteraceae bacterium]|nr:peptidase [Candidatus Competibacteraceae bacterium]